MLLSKAAASKEDDLVVEDDSEDRSEEDGKEVSRERRFRNSEALLPWSVAQRMVPWDIIILIGAGYALAEVN